MEDAVFEKYHKHAITGIGIYMFICCYKHLTLFGSITNPKISLRLRVFARNILKSYCDLPCLTGYRLPTTIQHKFNGPTPKVVEYL